MHTDAVQALGKIAVDFNALNVHAMTLSAPQDLRPEGRRCAGHRQAAGTAVAAERRRPGARPAVAAPRMCRQSSASARRANWRPAAWKSWVSAGVYAGQAGARPERNGGGDFGEKASRIPNTSFFAFEGHTRRSAGDRTRQGGVRGRLRRPRASSASAEPPATLLAMGVPRNSRTVRCASASRRPTRRSRWMNS